MSAGYSTDERSARDQGGDMTQHHDHDLEFANDAIDYLKAYARERPEVAAMWCFGVGFILGWKLKPW